MRPRALVLGLVPFAVSLAPACSRSSESATAQPPPSAASVASSAAPEAGPPPKEPKAPDASDRQADVIPTSLGDLRIVPIHHGSVLFELGGKEYCVDPFHEGNLEGLPKADYIFITHPHPDHLDPAAISTLSKASTVFVCPPSVVDGLPAQTRSEGNPVVLKNGDSKNIGGIGVEAIAMYNTKRGPAPGKLFHEKGWGEGFVLTFGDKRVYLSGDTECTPEMRSLKNIDVAFVCMNLPYTMPPPEAAQCIAAYRPKILYPYHYRGSDLAELDKGLAGTTGIEVRKRAWY